MDPLHIPYVGTMVGSSHTFTQEGGSGSLLGCFACLYGGYSGRIVVNVY